MNLTPVTLTTQDVDTSMAFYHPLVFTLVVATAHYVRFSSPEGEATFSLLRQATTVHSATVQ